MKKLLRVLVIAALLVALAIPCLADHETTLPVTCDHAGTEYTESQKATCETKGLMSGVCPKCSDTVTYTTPALGHAWDEGKVTTEANCGNDGVKTYTCTREGCGKTKTEVITASGEHKWNDGEVTTEATCGKAGVKTFACTVCNETKTEEIPATGEHKWNDGEVTTEATCGKAGVKTFTCTVCNETKTEEIPATGEHKMGLVEVNDKPCKEHYTVFKCSVCGYVDEATKTNLPLADHQAGDPKVVSEATCTEPEMSEVKCTVCGDVIETKETKEALGHEWGTEKFEEVEPTCTEKGSYTVKCARCDATKVEEVPAKGHVWDTNPDHRTNVVKPTCTEKGSFTETCTVYGCGATHTVETDPLGHKFAWIVTKEADGCLNGEMSQVCSVCGDVGETQVIEGTGEHTWSDDAIVVKEPTCTEAGQKAVACTKCGTVKEGAEVEEIEALGHEAGEWITVRQPSATQTGKMIQKCTRCGVQLGKKYIRANGTVDTTAKTVAYVAGEEVANYAKIDLTVDGTTELDLVSANGTKVGKLVVEVKEGKVTVKYELSAVPADAFLTFVTEAPSKDIHAEKEFEFEKAISVADELAGAAAAYIYVEIEY